MARQTPPEARRLSVQGVDTTDHPEVRAELSETVHHEVMLPYVFVDHRPLGDFSVIKILSHSGALAHLLRDDI
jgi:hypothetical protein